MHRPTKKKQETWYIESKFGLSLNLSGWRYSTMNNLQYLVPFSPQGPCFRSNYQGCSVKKGVLRNFAKFTENTFARASFLIKMQVPAALLKERPWHRFFPVNFAKFVITSFSQNTSGRLLLVFMGMLERQQGKPFIHRL